MKEALEKFKNKVTDFKQIEKTETGLLIHCEADNTEHLVIFWKTRSWF